MRYSHKEKALAAFAEDAASMGLFLEDHDRRVLSKMNVQTSSYIHRWLAIVWKEGFRLGERSPQVKDVDASNKRALESLGAVMTAARNAGDR